MTHCAKLVYYITVSQNRSMHLLVKQGIGNFINSYHIFDEIISNIL